MCRIFDQRDIEFDVLCWERMRGESASEASQVSGKIEVLFVGGGSRSKKLRFIYPVWILKVFIKLLALPKDTKVYCLGFECAFPAYLAAKIKGFGYIFDDADRFSMIVRFPKPISTVIQFLEKKVSENSLVNIIPGLERYEFRNNKQLVIRNTPDKGVVNDSKIIPIERPDAELVIYVNGWMGETRGMKTIYEVCAMLEGSDSSIKFVAAGRVDGEYGDRFVGSKLVDYYGEIENTKALALYGVSDFVYTYYDPAIKINRYAESNKWGDAECFGVVPIVNHEVVTAEYLRTNNCCIGSAYADANELYNELISLVDNRESVEGMQSSIKKASGSFKYFDENFNQLLEDLAL